MASSISSKLQLAPAVDKLKELFARHPKLIISVSSLTSLLGLCTPWIVHNYRAFLSLGQGGLPLNVYGWTISTVAKPFGRETLSTKVYDQHQLTYPDSWLGDPSTIPTRIGARPTTGWHFLPHRQLNQIPDDSIKEKLTAMYLQCGIDNADLIQMAPSPHERNHDGMLVRGPAPHKVASDSRLEVAHLHPSTDGSLHAVLSPRDCKIIIERGWGERHPLSGVFGILPSEYLLIYAPRDEQELELTHQIIKAAVGYMTNTHEVV